MAAGDRTELLTHIAGSGWLRAYLSYASAITDAPREFHLAAGLAVLATAIGNGVTFRAWGRDHCPNIYALVLAESGIRRKTTSIEIAAGLLHDACPELLLPDEFSREKLVANLARHPVGLLKVPEFSTLLAAMQRPYMEGTKEFLTDMFDPRSEYVRETLGQRLVIREPALSILGASTTDWLVEHLQPSDLRGGFIGRFLLIAGRTRGAWRGLHDDTSDPVRQQLVRWLRRLTVMPQAPADFGAVRDVFNAWLQQMEGRADTGGIAPEEMGFYARLGAHGAKLCILYEVSERGVQPGYTIGNQALSSAMLTIELLLDDLSGLAETKLVFSKHERVMQELLERMGPNGGVDRSVLLKRSRLQVAEFDKFVHTLLQRGEIQQAIERTRGRSRTVYQRVAAPSSSSSSSLTQDQPMLEAEVGQAGVGAPRPDPFFPF